MTIEIRGMRPITVEERIQILEESLRVSFATVWDDLQEKNARIDRLERENGELQVQLAIYARGY